MLNGAIEISVIIPVYRDPEGIRDTLDSLLAQSLSPATYEIIVVDNGSPDETPAVVEEYTRRHPGRVRIVHERETKGSYAARNAGIREARGVVIAFLDANVTVQPDYLAGVERYVLDQNVEYLGCRVETVPREDSIAARYDAVHAFPMEEYFRAFGFVPTCCLTVHRDLLRRAGAFDVRLESGGDREFASRVERFKARKQFAADLVVRHPARSRWSALLGKQRRVARGAAQLHYYRPSDFHARQFSARTHLAPANPWRIHERAKARGVPIMLVDVLMMSMFKIPLAWSDLFAYRREHRRLRRAHRNAPA